MAINQANNKDGKEPPPTSQLTLLVRSLLGGYLVYLAFTLRNDFSISPVYIVAAAVFGLAGAALLVLSVRRIFNGDYDLVDNKGQRIDPDDLPEEEDDVPSWEELKAMGDDLSFLEDNNESDQSK